MRFAVRVTPRGGRDAVEGWTVDDAGRAALKVRIRAAPADGAANVAVVKLLASHFRIRQADLRIVSGHTARLKLIEVEGGAAAKVQDRIAETPAS